LRELGGFLEKSQQKSDWRRRPLTSAQVEYAALDAEILQRLHRHFQDIAGSGSSPCPIAALAALGPEAP
jgi:ribonuclease D